MSWPTTPISTANFSLDSDVSDTLDDLEALVQSHNTVLTMRGVAGGIASLVDIGEGRGVVPVDQLSGDILRAALAEDGGAGSGLDADLLDGLNSTDFVFTDGSSAVAITNDALNFTINKIASETNVIHSIMTLQAGSDSARGVGFGGAYKLQARTAASTQLDMGRFGAFWLDVTADAEYSALSFDTRVDGTLTESMRMRYGILEVPIVAPSDDPPGGWGWIYATDEGLVYEDEDGVAVVLGGSGSTSHATLTNLNVPSHHAWALSRDGTNGGMSAALLMADNYVSFESMTPPSAPSANTIVLYNDGDVLKYRTSVGVVSLAGTGVTDHGALTGLSDNDHPIYALLQPTGDVVFNDAGGDFNFRWEGDDDPNLFRIDAGENTIGIGQQPSNTSKLAITPTGSDTALTLNPATGTGLSIGSTTGTSISVAHTGNGIGAYIQRAAITGVSSPLVTILENDADFGTYALTVGTNTVGGPIANFYGANGLSHIHIVSSEVVINEDDDGTVDFRVESDAQEYMVFVDASAEKVFFNGTDTTAGRVNFTGGTLDAIYANATAAFKAAVRGNGSGQAYGVYGSATAGTAGFFTASSGKSVWGVRNAPSGVNPIAVFEAQSATDAGVPLMVANAGVGDYFSVRAGTSSGGADIFRVAATASEPTAAAIVEGKEFAQDDEISPPETNWWRLFFKPDGAYIQNDTDPEIHLNGGSEGGNVESDAGATRTTEHFEEVVTITAGQSSATTTATVPVGSIIERVLVRTQSSPGITYYVGAMGIPTLFATSGVSISVGSTNQAIEGAVDVPVWNSAAAITITATTGTFSGGSVRVTVFYRQFTGATS